MKSRIQKYLETAKAATQVVRWYAHSTSYERQIRGPWLRWFQASGPEEAHEKGHHASIEADVEFCAASMNEGPWCAEMLLKAIEILKDYERYGYTDIPTFLGELEK